MSFPRYANYKDSGVEWLGEVPEHWEVKRLGQIGRLSKGNGGSKQDEVATGIPCVRYGDLYTTHGYFIKQSRPALPLSRQQITRQSSTGTFSLRRLERRSTR